MLLSMKKFSVSCRVLFVLCLAVLAASCSDDDSDPGVVKSSAKAITSFKFATPAATGTVTESDKKIAVTVPAGTNVTELVPTIAVSEKAAIDPNTGVKQNFTNAVTYTVTAEDGSTQKYVVTVTVEEPGKDEITVTGISSVEVEKGAAFYITGTNFAVFTDSEIALTNIDSKEKFTIGANDNSTTTRLYFTMPFIIEVGEYAITVTSKAQSVELDVTLTVKIPAPGISGISAEEVNQGGSVTITGVNFSETGNEVRLVDDGGISIGVDIVNESSTSIQFTAEAPNDGSYTILVITADGLEVESAFSIYVGNRPRVTGINKTTFAKGEQIIVTGANLKSDSFSGVFFFWPATGNGFQKTVTVKADGTEMSYTIPVDFAPGTYDVDVQYELEPIKTFTIVIQ
jgi:hypothetical protein